MHPGIRRRRERLLGALTALLLTIAGAFAIAAPAHADAQPRIQSQVVRLAEGATTHIDYSSLMTGNNVTLREVNLTTKTAPAQLDVAIDSDGQGITITAPDWPDATTAAKGMNWINSVVARDADGQTVNAVLYVDVPRMMTCNNSAADQPQATVEATDGTGAVIDLADTCTWQTNNLQVGPILSPSTLTVKAQTREGSTASVTVEGSKIFYMPAADAVTGPDFIDVSAVDTVGRVVDQTVMVMVDGDQTAQLNRKIRTANDKSASINLVNKTQWIQDAINTWGKDAQIFLTDAQNGTAVVKDLTNVVYTPAAGFTGVDTLGYTVTIDSKPVLTGSIAIRVGESKKAVASTPLPQVETTDLFLRGALNTPQTITLDSLAQNGAFDSVGKAPEHGATTVSENTIVYTPAEGFTGVDTFTVTFKDVQGHTKNAVVTVKLIPPPPSSTVWTETTTDTPIQIPLAH